MGSRGESRASGGRADRARNLCKLACLLAGLTGSMGIGCADWRDKVQVGVANSAPQQTPLDGAVAFDLPGATGIRVQPRARYENEAWAVAVDDAPNDAWSEAVPLDVAFAWGPVAAPAVLSRMRFHLKRRYVSVRWDARMPLDKATAMRHLSNHHLIAAGPAVAESLARIRPGDFVRLSGQLVDLEGPAGVFRTSLSREDVGNGACEVVWVERVEVARPR